MTNRTSLAYFDYEDEAENVRHYGQSSPPVYPVKAINSKHIALIYTKNDWSNHVDNIDFLEKNLKGRVEILIIKNITICMLICSQTCG